MLTDSGALGGSVEYRLDSFHVFANWIIQHDPTQRVVPYLGAGLLVMAANRPSTCSRRSRDARISVGGPRGRAFPHRVGGTRATEPLDGELYWRSYMFVEAQRMSAKVDGQNLGGDAFVLGFRMEFNFH